MRHAAAAAHISRQETGRDRRDASTPSDAALVLSIAAGDRAALALLYERFASELLTVACRLLRAREEAEDTVQDVFLEVWRHADGYAPSRGSVATWLRVRTRHRALDRLKAPGRVRFVLPDNDAGLEPSHPETLDWDPASELDGARLWRCLGSLPAEQRAVIGLAYVEGLTHTEIGERLAIPLGTVKSRLARAASALRDVLGEGHAGSGAPLNQGQAWPHGQ